MRIHCLQHVPFETPAAIADWAQQHRHRIDSTLMHDDVVLPRLADIDMLVLMGGPMSVNDEAVLPWLVQEKHYLRRAIQAGKRVLGVCLGAQMIADVLGAPVTRNRYREIGWFPLLRERGLPPPLARLMPPTLNAFHWHGETFELPPGAIRIASSAACRNQIFSAGDRILGLQCHLETTLAGAQDLVRHCGDELVDAPYVQRADEFTSAPQRFAAANVAMVQLLDGFFSTP
ncbi:MAG: type 1 glutamine amidotransferase [Pseudomonadota bacterium]